MTRARKNEAWQLEISMNTRNPKNEAYANVVSKASLEDILLSSSSFKASMEYNSSDEDVDRSLGSSVRGFHFDSQILIGEVECNVSINKSADAGKRSDLFFVEALYTVVFKVPGEHSEEAIRIFFNKMAPFAVWPYFRSHVAILATAANVEVPVLPIKKLVQNVETVGAYMEPQLAHQEDEKPRE